MPHISVIMAGLTDKLMRAGAGCAIKEVSASRDRKYLTAMGYNILRMGAGLGLKISLKLYRLSTSGEPTE